jgi:hypothetical protein
MIEKDLVFRRLKGKCQEMNFAFEGPDNQIVFTLFGFLFVKKIQNKFFGCLYEIAYLFIFRILLTTLFRKLVPAFQ